MRLENKRILITRLSPHAADGIVQRALRPRRAARLQP
jgi:hypothetical protein